MKLKYNQLFFKLYISICFFDSYLKGSLHAYIHVPNTWLTEEREETWEVLPRAMC